MRNDARKAKGEPVTKPATRNGELDYDVTIRFKVSPSFIGDILVTAFDGTYGGSWHWARPYEKVEGISAFEINKETETWVAVTVSYEDPNVGGRKATRVGHGTILKGIRTILDCNSGKFGPAKKNLAESIGQQDSSNIDADLADTIVQAGVFGEIIYG